MGQKMKVIFYRMLLYAAHELSPSEKIIYSFLVSKSITRNDYAFETDGYGLNKDELIRLFEEEDGYLFLCEMSNVKIAKELHMTRKTIIVCIKHLKELGYITNGGIYVIPTLLENGYFELRHVETLTGELLIFYSFLLDKAKKYNYAIDTYKSKLAESLGKSPVAITKLLNRLYKSNLAKRLENGKLLIYE